MKTVACRKSTRRFWLITSAAMMSLTMLFSATQWASADETDAKRILKSMSDYMADQKSISFDFDATLEIVTTDEQKLGLASSGTLNMTRPDKLLFKRKGGFADLELSFDGKELTLLGKNLNIYAQVEIPGSIDNLINELKETYNQALPGSDLVLSKSYDEMMSDVVDVKDLGTGVVAGVMCEHLAFRTSEVDWQIWIAQGKQPYPYRFVITSRFVNGGPQYTVQMTNWQTGEKGAAADYTFNNPTKAEKVDIKEIPNVDDLPEHFMEGDAK